MVLDFDDTTDGRFAGVVGEFPAEFGRLDGIDFGHAAPRWVCKLHILCKMRKLKLRLRFAYKTPAYSYRLFIGRAGTLR